MEPKFKIGDKVVTTFCPIKSFSGDCEYEGTITRILTDSTGYEYTINVGIEGFPVFDNVPEYKIKQVEFKVSPKFKVGDKVSSKRRPQDIGTILKVETKGSTIYHVKFEGPITCLQSEESIDLVSSKPIRTCVIKGCTNKSDEGEFIGDMCGPCHNQTKDSIRWKLNNPERKIPKFKIGEEVVWMKDLTTLKGPQGIVKRILSDGRYQVEILYLTRGEIRNFFIAPESQLKLITKSIKPEFKINDFVSFSDSRGNPYSGTVIKIKEEDGFRYNIKRVANICRKSEVLLNFIELNVPEHKITKG